MSKNKSVPPTGRMERRMWRSEQVAVKHAIKPKKDNRNACRKNKGRHSREDY
jgi:hypothetical protein